jgi:hypothetical protein
LGILRRVSSSSRRASSFCCHCGWKGIPGPTCCWRELFCC